MPDTVENNDIVYLNLFVLPLNHCTTSILVIVCNKSSVEYEIHYFISMSHLETTQRGLGGAAVIVIAFNL